jgi:protein-S-isoprenylcysteine O-methyltransferase Ste14
MTRDSDKNPMLPGGGRADAERDAAAVRVFPPGIPFAALVLGWALQTGWPLRIDAWPPESVRPWVGWGVAGASFLLLGGWAVLLFRRSGQNENPWTPTTEVVRRGPYRITRNPMYLQMVLILIGVGIALANGWLLLLAPVCAWALQRWVILPEEAYLERKFGEGYSVYKRRVRRWLGWRRGLTRPPGGPSSSDARAGPPSPAS